jgi:hypothetical protein
MQDDRVNPLLPDLPAVYTVDRRKLRSFALFIFGLGVAIWAMTADSNPVGRWFFLGFGVLFPAALWWDSDPRRHFLELTTEGFRIASGTRKLFVHWKDVQAFSTIDIKQHGVVAWYYTREFKRSGLVPKASRPLEDADGTLPGSFDFPPERLAMLLNDMLAAYGNPSLRNS